MIQVSNDELLGAALHLHNHILKNHWNGETISGPDPGIRFNARFGRFVKNYLNFLPWSDNLRYLQAQGYWILDNWLMADLLGEDRFRQIAATCSEYVLASQRSAGYWDYPNPEWKSRIATVEGCFAALGLLESYARLGHERFLNGAKKWYKYLIDGVGFRKQADEGMLAINYFAHNSGHGGGVPNNSTMVLWVLARLAEVTGDDQFLATAPNMVAWLNHAQLPSGELPYAIGASDEKNRPHFLCFQYNAFEFMDLAQYHRITGDVAIWPLMERLAGYLATALTDTGAARYDCAHETPEVTYYTSAVAQALNQATLLGLGDYQQMSACAFKRVLSQQRSDGGFEFYSRFNYRFLSDRRSYPRYLAMTLNHFLHRNPTQVSHSQSSVHTNVGEIIE